MEPLPIFELFECQMIATKAVPLASERRKALEKMSFQLADQKLLGYDGTEYENYWILLK